MSEREYDVVLFGATGFTGQLTAEYLARAAGPGTRGALAGRNMAKLEQVRERLASINLACADLPLLQADVNDPASIRAVAESTKVVITTVGPYIHYGEPLVKACAEAGTDYVDLTGEPEFVDEMWLRYHERAVASGARIVHSCGFDSIPYDLGVLFTVEQLPEGVPLHVDGFVRMGGTFSGGTYHSAINAAARLRQAARNASQRREARAAAVRSDRPRCHRPTPSGRGCGRVGGAVPDDRSADRAALGARARPRYGPDFTYGHYLVLPNAAMVAGLIGGAGLGIALAQLPPTRKLLLRIKDPGEGPTPEQRDKAWFRVRLVGEGGGRRVVTEVSGGDPGYGETSKMLARGGALPCARRAAFDGRPGDAGRRDGAGADRSARRGRDLVPGRSRADGARRTLSCRRRSASVFGRHPGFRALHAKGTLLKGTFTPLPEAAELTSAPHFQGGPLHATFRFSNGSGNPAHPDYAPDPRGLAAKIYLEDGARTDIVCVSSPRFPVKTPEAFIELVRRAGCRPGSRRVKLPARVRAPPRGAAERFPALAPSLRPPASYAVIPYYGIHAFKWIDAHGG